MSKKEDNGQAPPEPKPAIVIFWDNDKQSALAQTDIEQLRNPDIIVAVLEMIIASYKFQQNVARSQQLHANLQQQAQAEMMKAHIMGRR